MNVMVVMVVIVVIVYIINNIFILELLLYTYQLAWKNHPLTIQEKLLISHNSWFQKTIPKKSKNIVNYLFKNHYLKDKNVEIMSSQSLPLTMKLLSSQ